MSDTSQILSKLRARYAPPHFAFFVDVPDATGMAHTRRADAVAMSLWPSRGLELMGFEVKVSRSDWVRERDKPAKAEAIARFCDRWFLVVSEAAIVHPGELPPAWGLIVPRGDALVVKVDAAKLEAQTPTRKFLAALLRAAAVQGAPEEMLKEAREEGRRAGAVEGKQLAETERRFAADDRERLAESVAAFEKASGIKIDVWNGGRLGAALQRFLQVRGNERLALEMLRDQAKRVAKDLDEVLKATAPETTEGGGA